MAQNAIQKYDSDADFHANVRNPLENWYNNDFKLERLYNFLQSAEAADYPNSPLADLGQLRTALTSYFASTEYLALKAKIEEFIRI